MVNFLYNLYIFVLIQHDGLAKGVCFASQQHCYKEVVVYKGITLSHLIPFLIIFFPRAFVIREGLFKTLKTCLLSQEKFVLSYITLSYILSEL